MASWAGEGGGDRAEQGPITVVDFGSVDLAANDGELVAEHDDLEVFRATATEGKAGQSGYEAIENAKHRWSASTVFPLISTHDRVFGPHTWERFEAGDGDGYINSIAAAIVTAVGDADVIVLAQASMAATTSRVVVAVPVLSSPRLAVEALLG